MVGEIRFGSNGNFSMIRLETPVVLQPAKAAVYGLGGLEDRTGPYT